MQTLENAQLVRVIVGESDRQGGAALYEAIVLKARELGLAGATVTRACMGYGASSRMHTTKLLRLSIELPMVIEIVDQPAKIMMLMPFLDETVHGGLVTIQDLRVVHYRGAQTPPNA